MQQQREKDFEALGNIKTAVLIDGSFFLNRYRSIFPNGKNHKPEEVAKNLYTLAHSHVAGQYLYRIFYYDCLPLDKKVYNPISKKLTDYSKTDMYKFRIEFIENLKRQRKVALRLGCLKDKPGFNWFVNKDKLKELIERSIKIEDLKENDMCRDLRQKGVDIKIGLDIASLAYKRLVNKIILISGDSDFVLAAKVARREGIDFVLDPLWNHIDSSLFEHIDGLKSIWPKPKHK